MMVNVVCLGFRFSRFCIIGTRWIIVQLIVVMFVASCVVRSSALRFQTSAKNCTVLASIFGVLFIYYILEI